MSRSYRYALICFLVGCIPPPAGGDPSQTYPQGQYQQQQSGYDGYGDYNNAPNGAAGQSKCSAEASFGTAVGAGPMNYSVKTGYGSAATREEAATIAMNDCEETVNTSIL